jgi:hypothetical protein
MAGHPTPCNQSWGGILALSKFPSLTTTPLFGSVWFAYRSIPVMETHHPFSLRPCLPLFHSTLLPIPVSTSPGGLVDLFGIAKHDLVQPRSQRDHLLQQCHPDRSLHAHADDPVLPHSWRRPPLFPILGTIFTRCDRGCINCPHFPRYLGEIRKRCPQPVGGVLGIEVILSPSRLHRMTDIFP